MTQVNELVARVSAQLNDQWPGDEFSRWSTTVLTEYLTDAERMTVFLKPQSHVVTAVYQLVAGTRQRLPDGSASFLSPTSATHPQAVELISITRNMGADGSTDGDPIFPVDIKDMNEGFPAWRSATASGVVLHYMFNKNDRDKFEVYPAQPATTHWVEAIYSAVPPVLAWSTNPINLGGEYVPALETYMLYKAYALDAQNSEFPGGRAQALLGQYLSLIGRKDLIESGLPAARGSQHGSIR